MAEIATIAVSRPIWPMRANLPNSGRHPYNTARVAQAPPMTMYELASQTDPAWVDTVLADFDRFLMDHAACERKASALAMSLVAHYPDRPALVTAMTDLAIEELAHFREVMKHIASRGLVKQQREQYRKLPDYRDRLGAFEWELPEDTHPDTFVGDIEGKKELS